MFTKECVMHPLTEGRRKIGAGSFSSSFKTQSDID
jgi:hypothetical protein